MMLAAKANGPFEGPSWGQSSYSKTATSRNAENHCQLDKIHICRNTYIVKGGHLFNDGNKRLCSLKLEFKGFIGKQCSEEVKFERYRFKTRSFDREDIDKIGHCSTMKCITIDPKKGDQIQGFVDHMDWPTNFAINERMFYPRNSRERNAFDKEKYQYREVSFPPADAVIIGARADKYMRYVGFNYLSATLQKKAQKEITDKIELEAQLEAKRRKREKREEDERKKKQR